MTAMIRVVEPTGHETIVMADVGGAPVTLRVPADVALAAGASQDFSLKSQRLHAFDTQSGQRLPLAFA